MSQALERLARRMADDPAFLAAPLALYARSAALDDAALCTLLRCPPEQLTALQLCRAPDAEPASAFRRDVTAIADRFGLDADALATAVRHGQALQRLRQPDAAAAGMLLAARDRSPQPPSPGDPS
jgi:hypothetical protein